MYKIFALTLSMIASNALVYAQNKGGEVGNPIITANTCGKKIPILIGDRISKEQIGDTISKKGMVLSKYSDIKKMASGEYWTLENLGGSVPYYKLTYIYKSVQNGEFASPKESSTDLKEAFANVADCDKEVATVEAEPELPNSKISPLPKINCSSPLPIVLDDNSHPSFEERNLLWSKGFQANSSKAIGEMEKGYYVEITKVKLAKQTKMGDRFKYVATIKNKESKNKTSVIGGSASSELFETYNGGSEIPKEKFLKEALSFVSDCSLNDLNPVTEIKKLTGPTPASAKEMNDSSRGSGKEAPDSESMKPVNKTQSR